MADDEILEPRAEVRGVSDLQRAFIASLKLPEQAQLLLLLTAAWPGYAGSLSESTRPVRMDGATLIVAAKSAAFAQEFSLQSRTILKKIQKDFSGIQKLSIVQSNER